MYSIKSLVLAIFLGTFIPLFIGDFGHDTIIEAQVTSSIEGVYNGTLSYVGFSGTVISSMDASATISKDADMYAINFSENVPTLTGLKFSNEDGSYATIKSSSSVSGIVIDDGDLTIGVTKDGNTWAFSGEK